MSGLMDVNQGMTPGGLMNPNFQGAVLQQPSPNYQGSIPSITQGLLSGQMGPWSQLAYKMAGSPNQGPAPSVAVPQGTGQPSSSSGLLGGLLGALVGAAGGGSNNTGLLGLANNPTVNNYISGLLGTGVNSNAITSSTNAALGQDLANVGSDFVAPSTDLTGGGDLYSGSLGASGADLGSNLADASGPASDALTQAGNMSAADADAALGSSGSAAGSGLSVGGALGGIGDIAGIYNGINQGGLMGYGQAALDAYKLYGTVSPLLSAAPAAATAAPAAAAATDAAATGAGSSAGASAGLSAGAGAAAAVAIPLAMVPFMLANSGDFTAGGFVNSAPGSGMFTPTQLQTLQQKYQQLGEDGFWQWFSNDPTFKAFSQTQLNTGNKKPTYQPT